MVFWKGCIPVMGDFVAARMRMDEMGWDEQLEFDELDCQICSQSSRVGGGLSMPAECRWLNN